MQKQNFKPKMFQQIFTRLFLKKKWLICILHLSVTKCNHHLLGHAGANILSRLMFIIRDLISISINKLSQSLLSTETL